ncbi:putative F-box protein At1g31000 [Raphanus sativus]|uniref:F-box protein At1g31000 n=1 Tax=Raphanus sativus TaxID=3726 RepID=A0A6J0L1F3_RAPSA|nr:putative F-box protein At1g31000 [Raphanus sativus]
MMIRHNNSKKTKIGKDSNSLPPDLLIEILTRLRVKAVSRFFLVSKSWSTIISSQVFIRSFPSHSIQPQPPRLLYAVNSIYKQSGYYKCDVHYVNGLISFGYGEKQIITRPSTGKSIYLPRVRSREKIIRSFFGFDPVESQYKVLAVCKSEKVGDYPEVTSSEHKVFTLMGREGRVAQAWRMVKCNTSPHCPITNSVCINGVMYYVSSTGKKRMSEWFLMRFDVRTEKLDLLPQLSWIPDGFYRLSLINYQGKVTFVVQTYPSITTFDLWVMEDTVEWSKIRLDIPWTMSHSIAREI